MKAPSLLQRRGLGRGSLGAMASTPEPAPLPARASTPQGALVPQAQIVGTASLAAYPWLASFSLAPPHWRLWFVALGAVALWLLLSPPRVAWARRSISALAACGLLGTAFPQLLVIYARIVRDYLSMDYTILASLIHAASVNPASGPENLWFYPAPWTLLQLYLDPLTPLVNRVFDLTHDPFRLLAFHSLMTLAGPAAVWWLASRHVALQPFQFILPAALLMHPAVSTQMVSDYHESEVALGLLLLGTYWFFADRGRRGRGFVALLAGTLFKISYWPSWFMFGVLSAFRRQWRWTAAYGAAGVAALLVYEVLNAGGQKSPGLSPFLGGFGTTPLEILRNLVIHPQLWLPWVLQPSRWIFFLALLLPLGLCALVYPLAVVPVLPLVALSLLDASGIRTMVPLEYATEYLGYLVGGSLVGLAAASRLVRGMVLLALTLGTSISLAVPGQLTWLELQSPVTPELIWTNMTLPRARLSERGYFQDAAFSACAAADAPVLATSYHWMTYAREYPDQVWVDDAASAKLAGISEARWRSFETLAAPHAGDDRATLNHFPTMAEGYDVARYQQLLQRLPVHVLTPRGWDYWGGPRLADCAERFGYEASAG